MTFSTRKLPDGIEIRAYAEEEYESFIQRVDFGFGNSTSPGRLEQERRIFEADRAFVAAEGDRIVGTSAAQTLPLTVPGGGSVACGGVVYVSVLPTHRRQGILTSMMARQLEQAREKGDPVAALWASESAIYGRFGFGMAVPREVWSIPRRFAQMKPSSENSNSNLEFLDAESALPHLERVYEKVRQTWAGTLERRANWWEFLLADPEHERKGSSPKRHVVYSDGAQAEGYVTYSVELDSTTLEIEELMWTTTAAHRALWSFCLSVDLVEKITAWNQPPDDHLPWMLHDERRLRREPTDGLWVRILDIPAALSARTYSSEDRIVLRVRDEFCPENEGTYSLDAGPSGAKCETSSDEADLELDVADLGAAYLGGVSFTTLAAARRVTELREGALARADRMFVGERLPWCPQEF